MPLVRIAMFRGKPAISNIHFSTGKLLPGKTLEITDEDMAAAEFNPQTQGCVVLADDDWEEEDEEE